MSTLYLVRHAQASFLASDYDQLSELGRVQAERLGSHFSALGIRLDRIFVGPRRRHRQTAEALSAVLGHAEAFSSLDELDEYAADELLAERLPELGERHADLIRALGDASEPRARGRALDRLLQIALKDWASGRSSVPESWSEFSARTERALRTLTAGEGSGRRVMAVSSAGTIGRLVGHVLGASAETSLELGFMLNNSSVTEITFSAGRVSLTRFNVVSHLGDPVDWTRR